MRCLFYTFHGSYAFYPNIRNLPYHPRFTLISAFYPLIRVLSSYPRFVLSSAFYPLIRVLPSYPYFTLLSVHPSIRPSVRPSVRVLHFHPYPRSTLTLFYSRLSTIKAAFHFRVFHTHVYTRKTLNPTLYIF